MSAKLVLVGTPIGNLEDMSFRAIRTLKEADLIACEDTRQTIKLLNHFEIKNHLTSYHKFNENKEADHLIDLIEEGKTVALVSDAGLPIISDPGNILVERCREKGIEIEVIPGPNAALSALMLSGLDASKFSFIGFLPKGNKAFREGIDRIVQSDQTVILYESPHRLVKLLEALNDAIPERRISISREITKRYEETRQGSAEELLNYFSENTPKGEFVLVIEKGDPKEQTSYLNEATIEEHLAHYMEQGFSEKDAMKQVAKDRDISKREIYNQIKRKEND